ncbi:MAG: RusA family crossover junction endodeoxyribonuclease [Thermodesulfovibrionales bacterium]|nr:RusA family crossover junction endodeoxyribonuclease [Thermodesulfovibrionales bacterium]
MQQKFDYYIKVEWGRLRQRVFMKPVRLTFIIICPEKRVRDLDNYIGGTKMLIDALKKTFIFRDDAEWVTEIKVQFAKGTEGTEILIEETGQ